MKKNDSERQYFKINTYFIVVSISHWSQLVNCLGNNAIRPMGDWKKFLD